MNLPPVTVGARLSCISSFFKFLIQHSNLLKAPIPAIPSSAPSHVPAPQAASPLPRVQQLLQVIPDTVKGRRDLAIVLTLVLTARRRSEVINLTGRRYRLRRFRRLLPLHSARAVCAAAVNFPAPLSRCDTAISW